MDDRVINIDKFKDTKDTKNTNDTTYVCMFKPKIVGDVEVSDYKKHIRIDVKRGKFVIFIDPVGKTFQIHRASEVKL